MKNGVIMEIRGRKAVVLTPDGEFTTIYLKRNHTLSIGSEIKLTPKPEKNRKGFFIPSMPTLAGMATVVLLFVIVVGAIPIPNNDAVAAYVSFDINPSIEVGVNSNLEVVQYQAWNPDGEGLNLDRDTMHMPLSEFASILISKLEEGGYLNNQGQLLIVASNVEKNSRYQRVKSKLEETINSLKQNEVLSNQAVAITTILHADYTTRKKAVEQGVSPGRYMTYLAAQDRGVSITLDEARMFSMKKLVSLKADKGVSAPTDETQESVENSGYYELENKITQLNNKSNEEISEVSEKREKQELQEEKKTDPVAKESETKIEAESQKTHKNEEDLPEDIVDPSKTVEENAERIKEDLPKVPAPKEDKQEDRNKEKNDLDKIKIEKHADTGKKDKDKDDKHEDKSMNKKHKKDRENEDDDHEENEDDEE